MRIGSYDLQQIRRKIIDDVYKTLEQVLSDRKTEIAKQNRELWLKPVQHLLDQLPEEMVTRCNEYNVKIKYTPTDDKSEIMIDEKWQYRTEDAIINPVEGSSTGYSNASENKLHPQLQTITAQLCDDILKLRKEKTQIENYLKETTSNHKGSLQLKKVWPEHLHKYLPAAPIRVGKKAKTVIQNPDVPVFLKERLTSNLLEGN